MLACGEGKYCAFQGMDLDHYYAGMLGGVVGSVVGHPFDTLKVHAQTQQTHQQNWRGMARGLLPAIATQSVIYALLFGTYDNLKKTLRPDKDGGDRTSLPMCALAGGLTGVAVAPVTSPLELVKCRLQVALSGSSESSLLSSLSLKTLATRGLGATAVRCGLGNAAFFSSIEILQSHLSPLLLQYSVDKPIIVDLLTGSISGAAYWLVASPFDLIKSRQQTSYTSVPTTILKEMTKVVREGGIFALWRGCSYALMRTVPMQGAVMMTIEATLRHGRD